MLDITAMGLALVLLANHSIMVVPIVFLGTALRVISASIWFIHHLDVRAIRDTWLIPSTASFVLL